MGNTYLEYIHPLKAAGVTALTRASPGVITIPAGHSGRLKRIMTTVWPAWTTVVDAGGLVEIENDAIKGTQISYITPSITTVTAGGGDLSSHIINCDIPLVGPSTYTVWYTPYNVQNQTLSVNLEWETGARPDPSRPNYIKGQMPLKANAVTALTVAVDHNEIAIPSGKGGRLLAVEFASYGTLETVVNSGGVETLESSVDDWKPFRFVIPGGGVVGAAGGSVIDTRFFNVNKPLSGNAVVTGDLTPYDDQSQTMGLNLYWRGPDPV